MRNVFVLSGSLLVISLCLAVPARAQEATTSTPSLGDLAQKLKTDRSTAARKPTKVFTNDNMPARPPGEGQTAAGGMSQTPSEQAASNPAGGPTSAEKSSEAHDEKYFQGRFVEIQTRLAMHKRQLSVVEQKLSQNQMQYYADPNKTLLQEYSRADVTKLTQDIQKKKDEIAADEKAMDDLRDQLRRDGGNPGWLRLTPAQAAEIAASMSTEQPAAQETAEGTPEGGKEESGDKKKTKEYWQAKFQAARAQLAKAQENQQLAEDELNLLLVQQARELDPTVQSEVAEKIAAKKADLETKRAATDRAQKALDALEKAFKDSGAPEDWSKTE